MAPPDLNSLPPSRSPSMRSSQINTTTTVAHDSNRPQNSTPSPLSRSPSASLTSAAPPPTSNTSTAGGTGSPRLRGSPRMERRRSSMLMSWNLDDGSRGPGSTADPHHQRAPSLGELHQELENEQEAQVNRLLNMIRQQQAEIQQLRDAQTAPPTASTSTSTSTTNPLPAPSSTIEEAIISTPASSRPPSTTTALNPPAPLSRHSSLGSQSQSHSHSRSRRGSATAPLLSAIPQTSEAGAEPLPTPPLPQQHTRDEVAFYKAETQNAQRENEMLKERIRELEKLLGEARVGAAAGASTTGV